MHERTTDWPALAALLETMAENALNLGQVISHRPPEAGGAELLAYPIAGQGQVMAGLGWPAARAERLDPALLLRRRGTGMERYGAWLPARFDDGSVYLVRRWPAPTACAWAGGAAAALRHAQELLDE